MGRLDSTDILHGMAVFGLHAHQAVESGWCGSDGGQYTASANRASGRESLSHGSGSAGRWEFLHLPGGGWSHAGGACVRVLQSVFELYAEVGR